MGIRTAEGRNHYQKKEEWIRPIPERLTTSPLPPGSLDGKAVNGGKSFRDMVHFNVESPKDYADFIFDEIGKIVALKPEYVAFARNGDDIPRLLWGNFKGDELT